MLLICMTGAALAQDFEETDKEFTGAAEPVAALSAEVGGALTTGNADFWTVKGTVNGSYLWTKNKITLGALGLTGRGIADGDGDGKLNEDERLLGRTPNAGHIDGELRYDRYLGAQTSLYALGGGLRDTYVGYDLRTHEQVGVSRNLLKRDNTFLMVELGFDVAQEFWADGNYANVFAARGLIGFKHTFNETVMFSETIEVYENVLTPVDVRVINKAALTVQMSENLGLKVSNDLYFDNQPVEGFRPLDQTTLVSVVATIL